MTSSSLSKPSQATMSPEWKPGSPNSVLTVSPGEADARPTTKTKMGGVEQIDDILSTIGLMRFSNFNQDCSEEKLVARLEVILASGLPAGELARQPFSHSWPLLHAVEVGSVGAAKLLLEYGSPVDAPGESCGGGAAAAATTVERTPLSAAVYEAAQPQMVELLLHHGANPFVPRPASSPPAPRSTTLAASCRRGRDASSLDSVGPTPSTKAALAAGTSGGASPVVAAADDEPPFGARRRVCVQMLEREQATPHAAGQAECDCLHHNWGQDPERPLGRKRRRGGGGGGGGSYYSTGGAVDAKAEQAAAPEPASSSDKEASCFRSLWANEDLEPPPFAPPPPSALGKRPLRDCVEHSLTGGGPLSGAMRALAGPPKYRPSPLGPGVKPRHMSIGFGGIWAMSSSKQVIGV